MRGQPQSFRCRVEAERQEQERTQRVKHEAERRARRQQEEQAIEDAAIEVRAGLFGMGLLLALTPLSAALVCD